MALNDTINELGNSIINLVDKKTHRGLMALDYGEVGYDKEVFEDIRKYKHSTFDIEKCNQILYSQNAAEFISEYITEDGIVKESYGSNRLILASGSLSSEDYDWTEFVQIKFKGTSESMLGASSTSWRIYISPTNIKFTVDGTTYNYSMTFTDDTDYWFKFVGTQNDKNLVIYVSTDGENYTEIFNVTKQGELGILDLGGSYGVPGKWDGWIHKTNSYVIMNDTRYNFSRYGHANSNFEQDGYYIEFRCPSCYKYGYVPTFMKDTTNWNKVYFSTYVKASKYGHGEFKIFNRGNYQDIMFWFSNSTNELTLCTYTMYSSEIRDYYPVTSDYKDKWYKIDIEITKDSIKWWVNDTLALDRVGLTWAAGDIRPVWVGMGMDIYDRPNIDLKKTYMEVDGQTVLEFNKTGVDIIKPDNFDKMNNPTITENGLAYSTDPSVHSVRKRIDNLSGTKKIKVCWGGYYIRGSHIQTPCAIVLRKNNSNIMSACTDFLMPDGLSRIRWAHLNDIRYSSTNLCSDNDIMITDSDNAYYYIENTFTANSLYFDVWRNGRYIGRGGGPLSLTAIEDADSITYAPLGYNTVNLDYENWVNLSDCKLYINDKLIWQPMLRIPYTETKAGYKVVPYEWRSCLEQLKEEKGCAPYYTINEQSSENFLKVGSPTISNNSIISGISNSNYISGPAPSWEHSLKVLFSFTLNSLPNGTYAIFGNSIVNATGAQVKITNTGTYADTSNGTDWISDNQVSMSQTWETGVKYNGALEFNDKTVTFKLAKVGDAPKEVSKILQEFPGWTNGFQIGRDMGEPFTIGSIYLSDFKIYADGKLIWTPYLNPSYTLPMGDVYSVLSAKANSSEIAEYSMPSNVYDELAITNEGNFTAPANGWFYIKRKTAALGEYVLLRNTSAQNIEQSQKPAEANDYVRALIPASKGDIVYAKYNTTGTDDENVFMFIYAEGSKGEKQ